MSGQEEALPSREESLEKGNTKSPEPPIKKKRGRPKKAQSSMSNSTAHASPADKTGEKNSGKPEEVDQGRSRRVRKVTKPVVDEEEAELDSGETDKPKACKKCSGCVRSKGCKKVARWNKKQREQSDLAKKVVKRSLQDIDKQVEDDGQLLTEEPEKENIDPSKEESSVKRAKKTKNESKEEVDAAQDDVSEAGSEDIDVVNESYLEEIAKFMEATKLGLVPEPPTKGDGNCWYRAVAEQVIMMIRRGATINLS